MYIASSAMYNLNVVVKTQYKFGPKTKKAHSITENVVDNTFEFS